MPETRPLRRATRVLCATALLATFAGLPARAQQPHARPTRLLQVTALLAARSGNSSLDEVPVNGRQAVEDVRGFLPYKSYRALDTVLIRSDSMGTSTMNGPNGQEYEVRVKFTELPDGQLYVEMFNIYEKSMPQSMVRVGPEKGDITVETPALAPAAPQSAERILATSFSATVGKTVVVGSSRLDGGEKALVFLFTALP